MKSFLFNITNLRIYINTLKKVCSRRAFISLGIIMALTCLVYSQQIIDESFKYPIAKPSYPRGEGLVVFVDEAHLNYHTSGGLYRPFAELLRADGYIVKASRQKFSKPVLEKCHILVISNAMSERNRRDWTPPYTSAFPEDEIVALRDWVRDGGSLFLIVDHMPIPGCADRLARAFNIIFHNGYATEKDTLNMRFVFKRTDDSLLDHIITNGRTKGEKIDSVAIFGGSAFQIQQEFDPILVLWPNIVSYMPPTGQYLNGAITRETPQASIAGWYQGAVMHFGRGRVAVFAEAGMFTAMYVLPERSPKGMNVPAAKDNAQFLLNIVRWLSGQLNNSKSR